MKYGWILIVILLVGGAWFWNRSRSTNTPQPMANADSVAQPSAMPSNEPADTSSTQPAPSTAPTPSADAAVTVSVTGKNFSFKPKEIRVKKGSLVKLTFNNAEGFHDWVVDEFNARTSRIRGGEHQTIEFTADKAGTFEYYCSVGEHRQMGMKGNLIVE